MSGGRGRSRIPRETRRCTPLGAYLVALGGGPPSANAGNPLVCPLQAFLPKKGTSFAQIKQTTLRAEGRIGK